MSKKKDPPVELPRGCGICHGRPHVPGDRGAQRCTCLRGQALAAQDRDRGLNSSIRTAPDRTHWTEENAD